MRSSTKISPVNEVVIAKRALRDFILRVCDTMERAHWHIYQVPTKRSSLMREFLKERYGGGRGPNHIWFGVSVGGQQQDQPHPPFARISSWSAFPVE